MNEKIEQLARQVDACYIPRYDMWQMDSETMQQFVKLIVQECATICEKYADVLDPLKPEGIATDYFQGGVKSASRRNSAAIKKRFGVE
jgi:ABC-type taurine transport system substrate-binding protein